MTYVPIGVAGLGQRVGLGDVAEDCYNEVKDADLDTKSGREQAFQKGAECAADGYCAQYGVPPGVCGPIAGWLADGITDIWNDIFGNEEEWEAYRARQAAHAAGRAAATQAMVGDAMMACAFYKTAAQLADLWDTMVPEKKGMWGPRVEAGPFEAMDMVKSWTDPNAPVIVVCPERFYTPSNNVMGACPFLYAWMYVNGMQHVGVYCHTFPTGYRMYTWPHIFGDALSISLYDRPAFVQKQMKERIPRFMEALGQVAVKFGVMVTGVVAKREAERAARNKAAWEKYEVARAEGEEKSKILNGSLFLGGAALLGGAWYFGRRRS